MEKVKLTKKQAEALQYAIKLHKGQFNFDGQSSIVRETINSKGKQWGDGYEALNHMSLDTIIRALYIGYEIELTPEEKVLELFNLFNTGKENENSWHNGYRNGIKHTLNTLGIKIDGIN